MVCCFWQLVFQQLSLTSEFFPEGGDVVISGIFGLPGSGKSLYLSMLADRAVQGMNLNFSNQTYSMFKHYDKVYTNFPFKGAYKLDFELLGKVKFENCLILVDEIMTLCDSRNYRDFGENLKFFFSQHRKFGIDIVYASQAYDDVDKKIRNLTDSYYYICRWMFNYSVVKPIRAFFRISDYQIKQGFEYATNFEYYFFDRRKYYAISDTNFAVSQPKYQAYTPKLWSGSDEASADHSVLDALNEQKDKKISALINKQINSAVKK